MKLEFFYNARGFGDLRLMGETQYPVDSYSCRTGSIDKDLKLKNALPAGKYEIIEPSVKTDEIGMYIHNGRGWKIRLYRVKKNGELKYTHYLIHPDGNKPGTGGCIGIQGTDAPALREELDRVLTQQGKIPVTIKRENLE